MRRRGRTKRGQRALPDAHSCAPSLLRRPHPEPSPETRVASPSQRIAAAAVTRSRVGPSIGKRCGALPQGRRRIGPEPTIIRSPVITGMTRVGSKGTLASRAESLAGMAWVRRGPLAGGGTRVVVDDGLRDARPPARDDGLQGRCRARPSRATTSVAARSHHPRRTRPSKANLPHKVLRPLDRPASPLAPEFSSGKIAPDREDAPVRWRATPRPPLSRNVRHRDCFRGPARACDASRAAASQAARAPRGPLRSCPSPRFAACASASS